MSGTTRTLSTRPSACARTTCTRAVACMHRAQPSAGARATSKSALTFRVVKHDLLLVIKRFLLTLKLHAFPIVLRPSRTLPRVLAPSSSSSSRSPASYTARLDAPALAPALAPAPSADRCIRKPSCPAAIRPRYIHAHVGGCVRFCDRERQRARQSALVHVAPSQEAGKSKTC